MRSRITARHPCGAIAAPVWLDGKLDVGGAWSSCGTAGRARWTVAVMTRKISSSPTIATTVTSDSRQRPSDSRKPTKADAVTARATMVSAVMLPTCVTASRVGVQCSTAHWLLCVSARPRNGGTEPWTSSDPRGPHQGDDADRGGEQLRAGS